MDLRAGDVFIFIVLSFFVVQGEARATALTREEDLEIEQQLKRLNKPAVKTIRTEQGDLYYCVDFYKQPAFDHPLLKNHSFHFQMKPNSYPKRLRNEEDSSDGEVISVEPRRLDCPFGTVPIRRVTKADLIRAKLQHSQVFSSDHYEPSTAERHGLHLAVVRTKYDGFKRYNGGGMRVSIENPQTHVNQYSAGRLEIANGPDAIQVGWMVNPTLYGDNRTRGFISTKTAGSSCFNTVCGFIIVTQQYAVDVILEPISHPGKTAYVYENLIYRDKYSGNWWLELGSSHAQVGFWPHNMFSGLQDLAYTVNWGGEVLGPPNVPSAAMGRGLYLKYFIWHDSFVASMTTINEDKEVVDAEGTEDYKDLRELYYGVKDDGFVKHQGRVMLYGGPGGATGY